MNTKTAQKRINAPRVIMLSFAGAILAGAILLMLPYSTRDPGMMNPVDALFTSASAVCVTGLIVVDTGTFFTPFGQSVILILIQLGGLGIMTLSTFFLIMLRRRLTLKDRLVLRDTLGEKKISGLSGLIILIVGMTVFLETLGGGFLAWRFHRVYGYPLGRALSHGFFHSVSAFCNAGFSLYSDSLTGFAGDGVVIGIMGGLILLGGIGFVVWFNLTHIYFWRRDRIRRGRIRLQTRIVLAVSGILLLVMFLFFLGAEWNNTLRGHTLSEKLLSGFFHAVTPRTAGFNTVPVSGMLPATLWLTIIMMFIGASPGSTGGGIKTVTFAVILASVYRMVTDRGQVLIGKKSIAEEVAVKAISIAVLSLALIFTSTGILLLLESPPGDQPCRAGFFGEIFFEAVSAFGTVGLSTGVTPTLSYPGKLVVTATMFLGRIGPLTLALLIGRRRQVPLNLRYPQEGVMVG
jgi:trk system potassium uptake protein